MDRLVPPPSRDPDFGAAPTAPGELLPSPLNPHLFLRVVANPFLGFAALLAWVYLLIVVFRELRRMPELLGPLAPAVVVVFAAMLWLSPSLFQFHCLDCGCTGRLSRWREHSCLRSSWRRSSGRPRRMRGPPPLVQVVIWLWVLVLAAIWAGAHGWGASPWP